MRKYDRRKGDTVHSAAEPSAPAQNAEGVARDDPFRALRTYRIPRTARVARSRGRRAARPERVLVIVGRGHGPGLRRCLSSSSAKLSGQVTVFAAASLKESFSDARRDRSRPPTRAPRSPSTSAAVTPSPRSITGGRPGGRVRRPPARGTMATVTDAGAAGQPPATFVRNQLEIATLPGNPEHIASLKDLTGSGLKVVLCDQDRAVRCRGPEGPGPPAVFDLTPVSYEQDVKAALTKVELKEVGRRRGLQDRREGGRRQGGRRPTSRSRPRRSTTTRSPSSRTPPTPTAARAFVELVKSAEGQAGARRGAGFSNADDQGDAANEARATPGTDLGPVGRAAPPQRAQGAASPLAGARPDAASAFLLLPLLVALVIRAP